MKKILKSIKRVFSYLPVLWHCWEFDWTCILKVLKHQLARLRHTIERSKCPHTRASYDIKNIRICEILCERILDDDYCVLKHKAHDGKWGDYREPLFGGGVFSLNRTKTFSKEDEKKENDEFFEILKHEEYLREQDLKYLCRMISKHLFSWWV